MPRFPLAAAHASALPSRQVHLDFHTSPLIPDVASEFDPREFAETMKRARVNSVTVFARCHHGMCYYPSKVATVHPHLGGRDLLGEMIEALHREGIRCPIYTTVAWDEDIAQKRPEWRMMHADGTFARSGNSDHTKEAQPGGWHFNDWLNADYQDLLEEHTRELCTNYALDGLFYDIVFFPPAAHFSEACQRFRMRNGFTGADDETFQRFQSAAKGAFARRFTRLLRGLKPRASVFYNSIFDVFIDGTGGRVCAEQCSHIEIESLPSGFWGYFHFPRLARGVGRWGRPWLGMTGRFQKMWGDFGGIKPQAALEFECFRSQALGGGNSIGDQLPPRGTLDRAAYELIGAVYTQCEAAESFYADTEPVLQIGVLSANHPARNLDQTTRSDEGAILMLEETHYDVTLLDRDSDLRPFELLILPDETVVDVPLARKLRSFHARGGRLLLSHRAGRDAAGEFVLDFLPLRFAGEVERYPTFWRARKSFCPELSASDRVVYRRGSNLVPTPGLETWVDRVLPYFQRTDLTFCSHFHAPPVKNPDRHPAVVAGEGFVYFADPIFREYREVGNVVLRDVWRRAVEHLIGPPPFGAGLPTTMLLYPRRRGRDLLLTLLHYVPLRKSLEVDVLEERMSFAGETLRLPPAAGVVRVYGADIALPRAADGGFALPTHKGRLLLEIPGFFSAARARRNPPSRARPRAATTVDDTVGG
jgi:hypothetical protein